MIADRLRILDSPTVEELEGWLTQQVQDEFGTYANLLRAIAWARRGAYSRARADVEAALAKQPAYELVELVAALIAYVTRDYARSLALLRKVASTHKYLAAQTLRVLEARAARLGWMVETRAAQEQLAALGVRDLRAHIHGLQRARVAVDPSEPEAAARRLWDALEHQVEQLGVELDELLTRAPTASLARTLRARLHLRLDQLDPAAAVLADASDDALAERWALLLARGRAAEIVAAPLPASASVRVIRLRAEALLEVGELEAAAELARTAAQRSPRGSAGAALLGILIDAQLSGQGPSRERFADLYRLAPGLLSDAARELELALWIDDGLIDDRAALLQCCERARRMLTADRGVRLWYATHSGDGEPRLRCNFARNHTPAAHDEDREDLEQAARLLTRALDKRSQSSARRRAASARTLDDDQIERFIADGYVHLRGAFPRELAQAVVSGAQRRLCEQPERWLQGERAAELAELLRSYDPDDPQTWPEGRVDLLGDRRFAIGSFSPDCERAVMRLLGGPQRVRTYSWADNLIIQFPTRSELGVVAPQPDQHSWHLDAPQVDTRLDNIRAGLLVFVLFGDIQPSSGNTWLALDSPARVARRLAASPDGVDFCELEMAPTITRECQRFFELTGEAGDIFLVHPLMLHSASPNPSPRVRWLGNPMIYVEGALDHRRRDPSPVELAIARALRE